MTISFSKLVKKFLTLSGKMKKIDRETVQKILDTADIVEVVSDFVSLKRRGANYIGLCPFHNERTPSFSVSKSKGICKCFSCGKGGSPVNFLMELEQLSYNEALRYLARKYNIEIQEHEMTDAEREAADEREALLAINDFALKHFEHNICDTEEGKNIGYAYFRERGINDLSIKKYHLGYAIDKPDELSKVALAHGYSEKYLLESGLCANSKNGGLYDRFKGRVVYPIFSVSGRVVAFGGRTLRKDKDVAKYVNSPETALYRKSYELYGLYQAKPSIVKKDKCFLVEGYMDVISMSQIGVDNVVASSGTSLTEGQIRLIHRFTNNVTVIYDSDPAGIKASLRGIDMLLAEGLDIKVLLLPDGEDPDSFAQTHSLTEVESYIADNETDFIRFKTRILLADVENDPIRRARVITDIVGSIAKISDQIKRQVYIQECSRMLDMNEKVLSSEVDKTMSNNAEKKENDRDRIEARHSVEETKDISSEDNDEANKTRNNLQKRSPGNGDALDERQVYLEKYEREIIRYIVRYGMVELCNQVLPDNSVSPMILVDFVNTELSRDGVSLSVPAYNLILSRSLSMIRDFKSDVKSNDLKISEIVDDLRNEGYEAIRREAKSLGEIENREKTLTASLDEKEKNLKKEFAMLYLMQRLVNDSDDAVRKVANELSSEKYQLSKVHSKFAHIESEDQKLDELVPLAIYALKNAILTWELKSLSRQLTEAQNNGDIIRQQDLIRQIIELKQLLGEFARVLGDRVVTPQYLKGGK